MITDLYQDIALQKDLKRVQGIMEEQIERSTPFIREALESLVQNKGKMLRPALLLLSSRFVAEKPEEGPAYTEDDKMHKLAAAVEMLHMATLVHDDIIDQAPTRRGIPTLHSLYGARNAVLLGDFLFTRSFQLASEYTDIELGRYIAKMVNSICESEIRQHGDFAFYTTNFKEYHRRIMGKTAALFAVSAYVGAYESGLDERNNARLKKIGLNLGAGFQVIDDILDFSDRFEQTGKSPGTDIRQGIVNLPLLFALQQDSGNLEKRLSRRPNNGRRLKTIINMTQDLGGIQRARSCAEAYTEKALDSVRLLPEGKAKNQMEQFVAFLLKRKY